jgi:hypothetical protein
MLKNCPASSEREYDHFPLVRLPFLIYDKGDISFSITCLCNEGLLLMK